MCIIELWSNRSVRFKLLKELSNDVFWERGNNVAKDEQIVKQIIFLGLLKAVLDGLDAIESPVD